MVPCPRLLLRYTADVNSSSARTAYWESIVVVCASLLAAVRLFVQVSHYAVNLFFFDQWDFYSATLFERHSFLEMFRWQFGPHRLGLGSVLSRFLEPHFQWNGRAEAFIATSLITVAALGALYLKIKIWGPLSIWDVAIPLIFFTPAQYESLWVTTDFAHGPLPLLLLVLYCLALTCERAVSRYLLVLIVNFLAIYTGFGLLVGFVTPVWLILEYYAGSSSGSASGLAIIALIVSLLSLASFFVSYKFEVAVDCFSPLPHSPITYATFFLGMLAHNLGARGPQIVSLPLGAAMLAAMILVLVAFARRSRQIETYKARSLVPSVLVTYCLLFCAATAYGRSCLGSHLAFESRYTNYLALGMLGVYFHFYSIVPQKARTILLSVLAMFLVGSIETRPADRYFMEKYHEIKATWRNCYLSTENIGRCNEAVGSPIYPTPERTHLQAKLEYLKQAKQNLYSNSR